MVQQNVKGKGDAWKLFVCKLSVLLREAILFFSKDGFPLSQIDFSLSLQCTSAMNCNALQWSVMCQTASCNTMYQNNQDPSLLSGSDILRYIWTYWASAIYDNPINRRYIRQRWPVLVISQFVCGIFKIICGSFYPAFPAFRMDGNNSTQLFSHDRCAKAVIS